MKVVKYQADGEYYKSLADSKASALHNSQVALTWPKKAMYDSQPFPQKNSTSVLKTIEQVRHTPKERFDPYLPTNSETRKLVESHVFVDGAKGLSNPLPTPALRNSLYLGKTEFQMNEDHFGKKSLVTNAQWEYFIRANSRDLPEWCLGSMKYYKPEYFDISQMKKGPLDTTKRDIFGKKAYPDNAGYREQFTVEMPFIGSRNVKLNAEDVQKRQMEFRDTVYEKNIRSKTTDPNKLEHLRMTNVDLKWPDDGKGKASKQGEALTKPIGVAWVLFTAENRVLFSNQGKRWQEFKIEREVIRVKP